MYYIFKQTYIWDAHRNIDENKSPKIVRAKTEERARRKLPHVQGREWVLVGTKRKK